MATSRLTRNVLRWAAILNLFYSLALQYCHRVNAAVSLKILYMVKNWDKTGERVIICRQNLIDWSLAIDSSFWRHKVYADICRYCANKKWLHTARHADTHTDQSRWSSGSRAGINNINKKITSFWKVLLVQKL